MGGAQASNPQRVRIEEAGIDSSKVLAHVPLECTGLPLEGSPTARPELSAA